MRRGHTKLSGWGRCGIFGYIKPYFGTLTVFEYERYKAIYCGVCRELGAMGGWLIRSSLSYDFVFAALFMNCAQNGAISSEKFRCPLNPLKKRGICRCAGTKFAAAAAVISGYYSLTDAIADSSLPRSLAKRFVRLFWKLPRRRAAALYPEAERIFAECVERQRGTESGPAAGIDAAADPTAAALGELLAGCEPLEEKKDAVRSFGYMLGRWIYLIDAADDLEKDRGRGAYNPFASCPDRIQGALNLTVTEVSRRYELLPSKYRHPIVENIIEYGLPQVQLDTLRKKEKAENKRSARRAGKER